jgi:hypothetical protein
MQNEIFVKFFPDDGAFAKKSTLVNLWNTLMGSTDTIKKAGNVSVSPGNPDREKNSAID